MDKVSYYNNVVYNQDNVILYNTLSDYMISLSKEEYTEIEYLLDNLDTFRSEYPDLYKAMKDNGFIINSTFDELSYIKLQNNHIVYADNYYHVIVNPTLDCNLKCWYCSTEYAKAKHNGGMNDKTILNLKKHLYGLIKQHRVKNLYLDWFGGEPMLQFDKVIIPVSSYVKEILSDDIIYNQHMTTNATLIDEHRVFQMKDLGFTSFQIPIDGNEHRHNQVKFFTDKSSTYKRVIDSINLISSIIPNVGITLRINYDYQTLKNILDIANDISDESKKCIRIDFQKVWQIKDRINERNLLIEIKEAFNSNGFCTSFWAYTPMRFHRCYADRISNYVINYDGRIFKCAARDYGDDKVIGHLLDNGDIEWNKELLSTLFSESTFNNSRCLKCKILPICMGPCIINCHEAKLAKKTIPCIVDYAQYSFESYVIEEASKRKLINN